MSSSKKLVHEFPPTSSLSATSKVRETNSDPFEAIDIESRSDEEDRLFAFMSPSNFLSNDANAFSSTSIQKKSIYLSFYTPATMLSIKTKPYADGSTRCKILYNLFAFAINFFVSLFKYFLTKSNELTIYVTKDSNYPDYNYSHVEISTEHYTYVAKWGSRFTRIEGKCLSPETYGSILINLSLRDYDIVVSECENATNNKLKFNYVGSLCNFILPECVRTKLFVNGIYEKEDACFCSEFVSRALIKTEAFGRLFREERLTPPMVSPIKLCILVSKFSEENITNVTPSVKMVKKDKKKKRIPNNTIQ
jgi:hypothetical protein